ncbi:MAG: bile acid:sodium symporter [Hyphomicrobiales bacterium]|nr:MAG: bile acid:sodium symporter [Hyphomicrobiales bacterium]
MDALIFKIGLPIALAITMLGMGLGLTLADFSVVFTKPKAFFTGAILQLIILPLIAFAVISAMPMAAPFAVGMMILAACPGGATSNILTYVGRGDVALSVSLTALISLVGFITIPLITAWALDAFMGDSAPDLPIGKTMLGVLVIVVIPIAIGMLVHQISPRLAAMAEKLVRPLSIIVFLFVVASIVYVERDNILDYFQQVGIQVIALNLLMMILAAMVANAMNLTGPQRTAITLECGLQNSTIGLTIALTILGNIQMSVPLAVYGLTMLVTGFIYAIFVKGRMKENENDV